MPASPPRSSYGVCLVGCIPNMDRMVRAGRRAQPRSALRLKDRPGESVRERSGDRDGNGSPSRRDRISGQNRRLRVFDRAAARRRVTRSKSEPLDRRAVAPFFDIVEPQTDTCRKHAPPHTRSRAMRISTRVTVVSAALAILASPAYVAGQAMEVVEPFKVGTFEINHRPTVGLVLRDELIVDIAAANADLELLPQYTKLDMPADMLELIGEYEYGLKYRLYEIVNHLVNNGLVDGANRPDYIYDVEGMHILPPIMYPSKV